MAQVVVASAFGGPEVLKVLDQPLGHPGGGEVVIAVRAAGVNPIDQKRYSGAFGTDPAQLPMRLGSEVAEAHLAISTKHVQGKIALLP